MSTLIDTKANSKPTENTLHWLMLCIFYNLRKMDCHNRRRIVAEFWIGS